jgi:cyclase
MFLGEVGMKRIICLAALLTVGGLSLSAAGYQAPQSRPKIPAIQKVRDNLYVIMGSDPVDVATNTGGNTAVFVTEQGVVLVDTKYSGYGQAILDQVKSVTDKPVTTIINTHTHYDHTGSNTEFPSTVEFVAHENTKANLSKATCAAATNCDAFKGGNAKFLPKRTFKDKMSLFSGKDQIDLYYFGPGHTNGDTWVVFRSVRTMHTGDMFSRKLHTPAVLPADGGRAVAFADTLEKALQEIKNVDTIIPGHAPIQAWNDLKLFADYYRDFLTSVQDGMKAGKSVEEVARAYRLSDKYKSMGYYSDSDRVRNTVQMIYAELKK